MSAGTIPSCPPETPGWALTPEGAVIHVASDTAIIADVHLGYEWSRAAQGDIIPQHSLTETLDKLTALVAHATIRRLVVAGDLVENRQPCARTARDVRGLVRWLRERAIEPVFLRGNHDPIRHPPLPSSMMLDGWTILHGDRALPDGPSIFGHHHPALKAGGLVAPCFLIGVRTIALPAFSPNAAGLDVSTGPLPQPLRREPLRCWAGLGGELLDFGLIAGLAEKLAAKPN